MRKMIGLLALLMVFSLLFWDKGIAFYVHQHHSPFLVHISQAIAKLGEPRYNAILWPIVFFFVRFVRKKEALGNDFLYLSLSIIIAMVAVEFLKVLFGRSRPELLFTQEIYTFSPFQCRFAMQSFPSGHAGNIGAIFGVLSCLRKKYTPLFVLLAILLSFSRIILDYHYLSDIFAGVIVGLLVARYVYDKMKQASVRFA